MKKYRTRASEKESKIDINMSPLVDCIFLLLIFFIVTSSFVKEAGVQVKRPRAISSAELDRMSVQVGIASDGQIYFGGDVLALNRLRGTITRQLAQTKQRSVVVITDKTVPSGRLLAVVDECKLAGAETVSVATEK